VFKKSKTTNQGQRIYPLGNNDQGKNIRFDKGAVISESERENYTSGRLAMEPCLESQYSVVCLYQMGSFSSHKGSLVKCYDGAQSCVYFSLHDGCEHVVSRCIVVDV
jgi:hypothetical protein